MGEKSREELHRTYGGLIYESDFWNRRSLVVMAKRIASDFEFDERCRLKSESNSDQ